MLLYKRSIKSYTTSCDVSWGSVANTFHSTLIFNRLCKFLHTLSIHHIELIYMEQQTDRQAGRQRQTTIITDGNHRYWWNVCGLTSGSSFIEENDMAIGSTSSFIRTASPTIFIAMTSLLSSEDCTGVLLHKPCSAVSATVQLCKTNVLLSVMWALRATPPTQPPHPNQKKNHAGRTHITPQLCSEKCRQHHIQNSHLKQCISWGYGIENSILYWMYVTLLDIWACGVYIFLFNKYNYF